MSGALWWADISIYNLNPATEQLFLQLDQGDTVTLSAGYQVGWNAGNNVLFKGQVWQPMWSRENVTDFKVTLRCVVGLPYLMQNFVSFPQGPMATQSHVVQRMAKQARNPFELADSPSDLDAQYAIKLPRSKAIFGRPIDYLRQMAAASGFPAYYADDGGLHLSMKEIGEGAPPDIVYMPPLVPAPTNEVGLIKQTLIGVPEQTQLGALFEVLLDSDVALSKVVKLDMTAIRQQVLVPSQSQWPAASLSQDQTYVVYEMRHVGDTRGAEWHTEITGVTPKYWLGLFHKEMVN